jgi:spermidine synthase
MYLDRELQLTSNYGDFYHEALVHPIMASLGRRGRRALVIGAGDGGVATALLRYPNLAEVTQVEIDQNVVDAAQTYLPNMSKGYGDPRHRLIIADAVQWVKNKSEELKGNFDICIIDSTDEPLNSPWDRAFFGGLKQMLAEHGAVVQNMNNQGDHVSDDFSRLHQEFQHRFLVSCNTPDYPSPYLLAILTEGLDPFFVDWSWWSSLNISTVYYHPTLHAALLSAPRESMWSYLEHEDWSNCHDASWSAEREEEL